ncbi:MAG: ArsR family transcriptional regulator [Methanomicrobiales archaeon]
MREIIGISDSKLSYHLNALKCAGLIVGNQQRELDHLQSY